MLFVESNQYGKCRGVAGVLCKHDIQTRTHAHTCTHTHIYEGNIVNDGNTISPTFVYENVVELRNNIMPNK